jgi:DNA replication protein DnaC
LSEVARLFKQADIPERYRWKFQEDFHILAPDGTPVEFAEMVQSYVSTLADSGYEPRRGYLLYGSPGTGKTLLGCIMLNELILHRCKAGRFINLSRTYFQKLRDTFSETSKDYGQTWKIFEELCKLPYLLLDDFGVQRDTPWEQEMLYDLVDARYGEERFTIVTTNQPSSEIQQLSHGRVYSRLMEMCHLVEMEGMDYRLHLQPQR